MRDKQARIIAVANEKGGVGKTATVVNLGAALSQKGKQVLIVDMDPQASATQGVGVDVDAEMFTTYDVVKNSKSANAHSAIVTTQWEGLDVIPASPDLAGADIELVNVIGRENRLKKGLAGMSDAYDFILLDTPPSLSLLTVNVFAYAGEVLVPCQTHPYAYAAMDELFDTIQAVKEEINPGLALTGIVATMFDSRTRVSQNILDKLKKDERHRNLLLDTVIRVNTTIAESADVRKPVVFFRTTSSGSDDYVSLAGELLRRG